MIKKVESAKEKMWIIRDEIDSADYEAINSISSKLGINRIVVELLYKRGYRSVPDIERFIKLEGEMFCDPLKMMDMEKGVSRVMEAVQNNEKITIYGDYDVDGVTSVCTLYLYLKSKGATVDYYIPNRAGEGYGVSTSAIDTIKAGGTKLIITVDTGITANAEVDYAREHGVDFVITDHHECRADIPLACAVINPHRPDCPYPFKELAGVGVVFKFLSAYETISSGDSLINSTFRVIKEYADLVCIGTIADVMPIKEENRIIVKYGLGMIENTKRVGLAALIEASCQGTRDPRRKKKVKITSSLIGFTLAPRINAAGRVRSAIMAVELFLSDNYQSALRIAEDLCTANRERQAEENKIMMDAQEKISKMDLDTNPVIVIDADDWHHGVIGIVSSRITEKYSRPSILVSFEGNDNIPSGDNIGKGSGRSVKGLNLVDALCKCEDLLVKFGGHELAAGLSVTRENLPLFRQRINEYALETLNEEDLIPVVEADMEIQYSDINIGLADSIQSILEPFGVSNPVPMFIVKNVNLVDLVGVSEGKHSRIVIGDGKRTTTCMYFSNSPDSLGVFVGDKVDILFSIDINEWQDRRCEQLIVRDIKPSILPDAQKAAETSRFEEIKNGATFKREENIVPDRDDCAAVYSFIQRSIHQSSQDTFTHNDLMRKISVAYPNRKIGYIKLKFIFMIFRELNILDVDEYKDDLYKFTLHFTSSKKDLDKSGILRRLRQQQR